MVQDGSSYTHLNKDPLCTVVGWGGKAFEIANWQNVVHVTGPWSLNCDSDPQPHSFGFSDLFGCAAPSAWHVSRWSC